MRLRIIVFRERKYVKGYMTDEDYRKASKREEEVANEFRKAGLKVEFKGYGAGVPRKFEERTVTGDTPLDLEVEGYIVVEVMGSDCYGFEKSYFFPVALDKVERANRSEKPTYFVFVLDNEPQPNKWWIDGKRCDKYEFAKDFPTKYGPQDIYKTNKYDWTRGLQSLIDELLKIEQKTT